MRHVNSKLPLHEASVIQLRWPHRIRVEKIHLPLPARRASVSSIDIFPLDAPVHRKNPLHFHARDEIILRGTTLIPRSLYIRTGLSFTRNVRYVQDYLHPPFTLTAPVGNSRFHLNLGKLAAGDFPSL